MRRAPPIIAGDSHITCFGVPQTLRDGKTRLVPNAHGDDRFEGVSGRWPRDEAFFDALGKLAQGRTLVLSWKGSQHNPWFLLRAGRAIDFVLAEAPDLPLDETAEIVPDRAIEARFANESRSLEATVSRLRAAGVARIALVASPPPRRDMERLRLLEFPDQRNFAAIAAKLGLDLATVPFASPTFMYKAWRVAQRQVADVAARTSVEYFGVPQDLCCDGYLRDEYAAEDWTHGNEAYGARMRDHLHEYLEMERT